MFKRPGRIWRLVCILVLRYYLRKNADSLHFPHYPYPCFWLISACPAPSEWSPISVNYQAYSLARREGGHTNCNEDPCCRRRRRPRRRRSRGFSAQIRREFSLCASWRRRRRRGGLVLCPLPPRMHARTLHNTLSIHFIKLCRLLREPPDMMSASEGEGIMENQKL